MSLRLKVWCERESLSHSAHASSLCSPHPIPACSLLPGLEPLPLSGEHFCHFCLHPGWEGAVCSSFLPSGSPLPVLSPDPAQPLSASLPCTAGREARMDSGPGRGRHLREGLGQGGAPSGRTMGRILHNSVKDHRTRRCSQTDQVSHHQQFPFPQLNSVTLCYRLNVCVCFLLPSPLKFTR